MVGRIFYLNFLILFSGLFLFPLKSQAMNAFSVVINEIAWMGTQVEGVESKNWWRYEWLELYNNTENSISLDGWQIELYRTDLDWSLKLSGTIPAQNYFLIVASDKISPDYNLNYSNLGGKFNNNGQRVVLKDNLGNIVDSIDCFSFGKWFAGDNSTKQTMERKNPLTDGNNPENWSTSQNPGGTPKAKNSAVKSVLIPVETPIITPSPEASQIPSPSPAISPSPIISPSTVITPSPSPETIIYPSGIVINEILPSPSGSDAEEEWIVATIRQMRINSAYL